MEQNRLFKQVFVWFVAVLLPIILVLTSVRLVMTPLLLQFEYNQPSFPVDPYGFTLEERLYWSQIALDYLLNSEDISFLGDLKFDNGAQVYNERELGHMIDVKNTVRNALSVWYLTLAILFILGFWSLKAGWWVDFKRGLARGGWLTVIMIGGIILFVIVSFGILFVAFHNIFFQPGTWTFNFSDTLIRLFPQRFWRDLFLIVGGLTLVMGLGLVLCFHTWKKEPQ